MKYSLEILPIRFWITQTIYFRLANIWSVICGQTPKRVSPFLKNTCYWFRWKRDKHHHCVVKCFCMHHLIFHFCEMNWAIISTNSIPRPNAILHRPMNIVLPLCPNNKESAGIEIVKFVIFVDMCKWCKLLSNIVNVVVILQT